MPCRIVPEDYCLLRCGAMHNNTWRILPSEMWWHALWETFADVIQEYTAAISGIKNLNFEPQICPKRRRFPVIIHYITSMNKAVLFLIIPGVRSSNVVWIKRTHFSIILVDFLATGWLHTSALIILPRIDARYIPNKRVFPPPEWTQLYPPAGFVAPCGVVN